jgi:ABC-type phosphate transport system permease subunit
VLTLLIGFILGVFAGIWLVFDYYDGRMKKGQAIYIGDEE